jgi:DNA repair exonuclease SbcCD ATPase subunit
MRGLEDRLERIEREQTSLRLRFEDMQIAVDQRLSSFELRMSTFETRILAIVTETQSELRQVGGRVDLLGEQVEGLSRRVDGLSNRAGNVEGNLVILTVRLDGLGDDMRQRFRVVNDRLAELAA